MTVLEKENRGIKEFDPTVEYLGLSNTVYSFHLYLYHILAFVAVMAWEEPRKTGMQYRRLGNSGLHVSVLGLGGWLT